MLSLLAPFRATHPLAHDQISSKHSHVRTCIAGELLGLLSLSLSGCGLGTFSTASTASSTLPLVSGQVHGGQQPISGATIQLYAANTNVSKGASTALISSTIKTSANGSFDITGSYACPAPGALVYIVATGGNPGLPGSVSNSNLALMATLGTCGTLTSSTYVSINELTTVAAVQSLAPFMLDYAYVGANASNPNGLATAFNSAVVFVDPSTGQFRATPGSAAQPPSALMNTLANIIAACVNTSGGGSGNGSPCGSLLQYTSSTTDTVAALLSIAKSPTVNVSSLFGLASASSPFQPALAAAPISFVPFISLALSAASSDSNDLIRVDSQGRVWLLRPDAGTLAQYDSSLNLLNAYSGMSFHSGGLIVYMILDPSDNLWLSLGTSLVKISGNGTVLSPATGYPLVQSNLFTYYPGPHPFTSDAYGNIWITVSRTSDAEVCLAEYSPSGTLSSPPSGYCGTQNIGNTSSYAPPMQVTADSAGSVYLLFYAPYAVPVEKFFQSGNYVDAPGLAHDSNIYGYQSAVFDNKDLQIWANGYNYLDKLNLDGSVAFSLPATSPFLFVPTNLSSIAVDSSGDYWEASTIGTLVEVTPSGGVNAPCTQGYICGIPVVDYLAPDAIVGLGIDFVGNIFTVDSARQALLKIPGLASAK